MATSNLRYLKTSQDKSPQASSSNFTETESRQFIQDSGRHYPSFEKISDQLSLMGEPLSVAQMKLLHDAMSSPSQPLTTTQTEMNSSTCYANFSSSKESASPMSTSRSWGEWPLNDSQSMGILVWLSCIVASTTLLLIYIINSPTLQSQKLEFAWISYRTPLLIGVAICSYVIGLMCAMRACWGILTIQLSTLSGTAKSEKP